MSIKHVMTRVAAASAATVLVTVGAVAPVSAAGQGKGAEKSASAQGAPSNTTKTKTTGKSKGAQNKSNASTRGAYDDPQPESRADRNDGGANAGECTETTRSHAYCSTRDGSASQNGKGDGAAKGKPAAGSVGKADNKSPRGQATDGPTDRNAGYECDRNQGIGQGNPAHTGCVGGDGEDGETPGGETPGNSGENGNGHTPVTVCHLLGNGGYLVLTFDENAFDAHIAHGDLYPMPADGCPAAMTPETETPGTETPGTETPGTETPGTETPGTETPSTETPGGDDSTQFVEQERDEVAGVERERTANRAPATPAQAAAQPAEVAPVSGILPSTGAPAYLTALIAGIGLLAAGATMIARRRPQGSR